MPLKSLERLICYSLAPPEGSVDPNSWTRVAVNVCSFFSPPTQSIVLMAHTKPWPIEILKSYCPYSLLPSMDYKAPKHL